MTGTERFRRSIIRRIRILLLPLAMLAPSSGPAIGQDFAGLRARVQALGDLADAPAQHPAEGVTPEGRLRALYYDGLPYRGQPTRVFAWYGEPERRGATVPGVVLVHGGGGTAFKEWVRRWNDRGFAAISIAVEGQTDEPGPGDVRWKRHPWAGPARDGIYGDADAPIEDQWMYHAVADSVLAHTLLRSFPGVDAEKVGLMGISWGGIVASTVAGIDRRLAFVIPTYGCGDLAEADNQYGRALSDNAVYRNAWEPTLYLPGAKMPMLWLTWLRDVHFPLTSQGASYRAAPGPRMVAVLPNMKHSHSAGWNPPESYAFAESIVRDGVPWSRQVAQGLERGSAFAEFASDRPIDRAILFSTSETGFTGRRQWRETPAVLEQGEGRVRISAPLPDGTRAWFFNLIAGDLTASSDFAEVAP